MRGGLASIARRQLSSIAVGNPLQPFVAQQGFVLGDGGVNTALGEDAQRHVLWGAQCLFGKAGHERITQVHLDFLEAGADVIGTAGYMASLEMFRATDTFSSLPGGAITKPKFQQRFTSDVVRASVELAKQSVRPLALACATPSLPFALADRLCVHRCPLSWNACASVEFCAPSQRYAYWNEEANRAPGRLKPLVAATVGPAGDNLTPWSCAADPVTRVTILPDEAVSEYYTRKIEALALATPDLIALESAPSPHAHSASDHAKHRPRSSARITR